MGQGAVKCWDATEEQDTIASLKEFHLSEERQEPHCLSSDAKSAIINVFRGRGVGKRRIQRIGGDVFAES